MVIGLLMGVGSWSVDDVGMVMFGRVRVLDVNESFR